MMVNDDPVVSPNDNLEEEDNFYNDDEMEYNYYNKTTSNAQTSNTSSEDNTFLKMAFLTISTSIGGILTGYHLAIVSPALPSITRALSLESPSSIEIVINILYLGGILGSLLGGPITDFYGRRTCILWTCGIFFFGGTLVVTGPGSLPKICFGRFLIGMAMALSQIANVSYLTEMASSFTPPSPHSNAEAYYRGGMVCTNELFITFGIWFAYYIGYNVTYQEQLTNDSEEEETTLQYKYMYGVTLLWATLQWFVMYMYMPESQVWLYQQYQRKYQLVLREDDENSDLPENSSFEDMSSKDLFEKDKASFRGIHNKGGRQGQRTLKAKWYKSLFDWWMEGFLVDDCINDVGSHKYPFSGINKKKNPETAEEYDDPHSDTASISSSSRISRLQSLPLGHGNNDEDENYHANTLYDPNDDPSPSTSTSSFMISTQQYNKYALYLLCMLASLEQLCGHNVILNYIPELYANAIPNLSFASSRTSETLYNDDKFDQQGQLPYETLYPSIYLGFIKILVTLYVVMEVDRFGRRNLMVCGCVIMAFAHIFLLSSFSNHAAPHILQMVIYEQQSDTNLYEDHFHKNSMVSRILLTLGLSLLIVGYAISFGPMTHLITSELFPTHIRGRTLALSNLITYVMDYFINASFLWIQEIHHGKGYGAAIAPFITYFFNTVIAIGIIWISVPETMGCVLDNTKSHHEQYKNNNEIEEGTAGSGLVGVGKGKNLNPSIMSRIEEMWLWQYYVKSVHEDFISNMTRDLESYDNIHASNEGNFNNKAIASANYQEEQDEKNQKGVSTPPQSESNQSSPNSDSPVLLNMEDYTSFEIVENHDFTELSSLKMDSKNAFKTKKNESTPTPALLGSLDIVPDRQKDSYVRESTTLLEDLEVKSSKETTSKLIQDLEHALSFANDDDDESGMKTQSIVNHASVPANLLYNDSSESDSDDENDQDHGVIMDVDVNADEPPGSMLEGWRARTA